MALPLRTIRGEMELTEIEGQYRVTTPKSALTDVLTVRLHGGGGGDISRVPNQRLYYEALVETSGALVLGLAGPKFEAAVDAAPHLPEVGNHQNSWGFDGSRRRKRCVSSSMYGERWKVGDVIGVLLDIDKGEIRFGLNGKDLGVAFEIPSDELHGVYPAASLHFGQSVRLNFGRAPFLFDPPGVSEEDMDSAAVRSKGRGRPPPRSNGNGLDASSGIEVLKAAKSMVKRRESSGAAKGVSSGDEGASDVDGFNGDGDADDDNRGEAETGQAMYELQKATIERLLGEENFKVSLRQLQAKHANQRRDLLMTQRKQLQDLKTKREQKVRQEASKALAQQNRAKRNVSPTGSAISAQNGGAGKKRPRTANAQGAQGQASQGQGDTMQ
ncbi:unnamed protein product [Choristocarpus tenellus]